ncbi:hypothetical protein NEOLI_003218 [Neolecta irregularis DAH-3]|uniref:Uncharacterized protein n=1 Tax=Neolecta irregularis (strain DAH-3) TaxID=1198029 RepID=A0A1U7LTR2_NEOID|nr:hypothetical protein NEOLI_003218 [Neolecta irregularis DAH-3]|eukprot:OLL25973.1 hypothetical protein NEOLI_003218 [Neolecta irregularis DAH-3]
MTQHESVEKVTNSEERDSNPSPPWMSVRGSSLLQWTAFAHRKFGHLIYLQFLTLSPKEEDSGFIGSNLNGFLLLEKKSQGHKNNQHLLG